MLQRGQAEAQHRLRVRELLGGGGQRGRPRLAPSHWCGGLRDPHLRQMSPVSNLADEAWVCANEGFALRRMIGPPWLTETPLWSCNQEGFWHLVLQPPTMGACKTRCQNPASIRFVSVTTAHQEWFYTRWSTLWSVGKAGGGGGKLKKKACPNFAPSLNILSAKTQKKTTCFW